MKSEVAWLFVYHLSYNYLMWACFEVLSSSLWNWLSSSRLIFDYRDFWFERRIHFEYDGLSVKVGFMDITISILEKSSRFISSRPMVPKSWFSAVREIEDV